jgi:hypothetical protein
LQIKEKYRCSVKSIVLYAKEQESGMASANPSRTLNLRYSGKKAVSGARPEQAIKE